MTGQNDWQDQSFTSQVRDQAGHCPLLAIIFSPDTPSPFIMVIKFIEKNHNIIPVP